MTNKKYGIIPIININSRNLNTGDFGEYLTLLSYSEIDRGGIDLKINTELKDYDNEVLSTTFKSNKMNPNLGTIDTSSLQVPNQSLAKNKVKYITSIPINKELVMPIPEQFTNPNPTTLQIIKEPVDNGSWFLNSCIFQNTSIIMSEDSTTINNSGSQINNELKFKMFFNSDITFEYLDLESNQIITKQFRFTFKFIFSTYFLSSFITTFEYFNYYKDDLLNFLIQNKNIILNIDSRDSQNEETVSMSYLLNSLTEDNNLKIINIKLYDFKIIKDTEFYFNFETFKKSEKVYNCTFKLIPQDYISLISEDEIDKEAIQKNMNNFYQSFTNENINLFDNFINTDLINISEEVNIIDISTSITKDTPIEDPDYIKLKNFISNNLINFINDYNNFPNDFNLLTSIPTEISYNTYSNKKLINIGKRQIVLKFTNKIILNSSGIYSDTYVIQYDILENRLELIPMLNNSNNFMDNPDIIKSINYNLDNFLKSIKIFKSVSITNDNILDSTYNNFIIYNNTITLNNSPVSDQNTLNTNKETNKYRLKIIKNYNLTQNQINELSENNISVSGLTYSSYALSTIYVS
jgi:hypothetical protein